MPWFNHVVSCRVVSSHVMSCHVVPCHVMLCHAMSSTSRHVTSHHITSQHSTAQQHIASHRIASHQIASHHITSHHITLEYSLDINVAINILLWYKFPALFMGSSVHWIHSILREQIKPQSVALHHGLLHSIPLHFILSRSPFNVWHWTIKTTALH